MISGMSEMTQSDTATPWTLGWRLRRALEHSGLSVQQMADDIGYDRATLARWTHDKGRPPRTLVVKQWALRCGVRREWLEHGQGEWLTGGSPPGDVPPPHYRDPVSSQPGDDEAPASGLEPEPAGYAHEPVAA
jgi:transcriptional regulator with XRE-family HTH domain